MARMHYHLHHRQRTARAASSVLRNGQFLSEQPHASWSLDDNDDWQAPIDRPSDDIGYSVWWDENAYNADNTKGWKATKVDDTADPKTIYDWNGTAWVSA